MILYLAESSLSPKQLNRLADKAGANNFLFSFAFPRARQATELFCLQPYRRIFVDSGAYSAWTKGKRIDLEKYIAFCKQVMRIAKCPEVVFAALDVIPGRKKGTAPTDNEIAKACDDGWNNYQTMKQEGISPCLMTFHQGEHLKYLKRIEDDSDYFAVAPRKDLPAKERRRFLDDVFGYFKRTRKIPKIHGLGVSSPVWMKDFPFYSVDSTAWEQSLRSRKFRHTSVRNRRESWQLKDLDDGGTPDLRELLGVMTPHGEKDDPNGNSGPYFVAIQSMKGEVLLGRHITELWRKKGVTWNDQPPEHGYPDAPCDNLCSSCQEAVFRMQQAFLGE